MDTSEHGGWGRSRGTAGPCAVPCKCALHTPRARLPLSCPQGAVPSPHPPAAGRLEASPPGRPRGRALSLGTWAGWPAPIQPCTWTGDRFRSAVGSRARRCQLLSVQRANCLKQNLESSPHAPDCTLSTSSASPQPTPSLGQQGKCPRPWQTGWSPEKTRGLGGALHLRITKSSQHGEQSGTDRCAPLP